LFCGEVEFTSRKMNLQIQQINQHLANKMN